MNTEELREKICLLKDKERTALFRLVSDVVMADKVIDNKELDDMEALFGQPSSDNCTLYLEAQKLTFAGAIKTLARSKEKGIADLTISVLSEAAGSDYVYDPAEAYLVMAAEAMLKKNYNHDFDVYSVIQKDFFIGERFVIYLDDIADGSPDMSINKAITDNYNVISHLLSTVGFQFLYVPKMREMYLRQDDGKHFLRMVRYLFPTIPSYKGDMALEDLRDITTRTFMREKLCREMGLPLVETDSKKHVPIIKRTINPCLLVFLRTSEVVDNVNDDNNGIRKYADFMTINIKNGDVLGTVEWFVKNLLSKVSYLHTHNVNPHVDRLEYKGVFKLFFNLLFRSREMRNAFDIDFRTGKQKPFVTVNGIDTGLKAAQAAVYLLVIKATVEGGGLPGNCDDKTKTILNNTYRDIYHLLNNGRKLSKDADMYNRLPNTKSDINKALEKIKRSALIIAKKKSSDGTENYKIIQLNDHVLKDHVTIDGKPLDGFLDMLKK